MDEKGYKPIKYPNCNAHFENDYNVSRVLYVDNELKPKCKFREEITFLDNGVSIDKRAICIGFNPAKAEEEIDTTNKRLITLLWNEYNGYNLLNLYPEITDNKNQIDLGDKENIEFLEKLIKELEIETRDIILFFGRTTVIPDALKDFLLNNNTKNNIMITVHNGEFTHPGSNAKIDIINFNKNYLSTDTVIKVNKSKKKSKKK